MAERTEGAPGRSLTWLWMLLAVVVVAGFLTWLGMASEPSTVAVVEEENGENVEEEDGVTVVPRDTLAEGKALYQGQVIRVPEVQATGNLGPAVFWGELGTPEQQVPLLVQLDSTLVEEGVEVESGARYTITGLVQPMSDSIAGVWLDAGILPDEGAEMQATFADYYMEASALRRVQGDGDDDEADDDEGDDEG